MHRMLRMLPLAVLYAAVLLDPARAQTALCDTLAASKFDNSRPPGVAGVAFDKIDAEKAIPACRAALQAALNDARTRFQLARALAAADSNSKEAVELNRQAADQGFALAMQNYANSLLDGGGVEKNETLAVEYYRKAAELGFSISMNSLAMAYANGDGVTKDEEAAAQWFRKAAEAGDARASGD